MHNFATMDPNANIFSSGLALAFNIGVFIYWLYKVVKHRRNPITNALFFEMGAFRNLVKDHCDDKDKYFLTDMIPETPRELGFEPESDTPPVDGYVSYMPWWNKVDKRWPKLRTPLSADPKLVEKGIKSDPQWDVKSSDKQADQ